ncbi:hypothetical protein AIOL_003993 [Candidatus Rhodobacter oscarellae]|uniref:Uncharacterized protein n=1 Tax=Candidatus Rhodobacter oscarellae TaxID=1675527 RepID=A0A0J9E8F1_9RHOB|nr:hypothetical protein [Candidatus Rhodobacter lobularis]KMW59012.1 hypothetical protein AIOL_003993 [Candidatus Rhodobacter lobularis]
MIACLCGAAWGAERPIRGDRIAELLNGNTVLGIWGGDPYRQYFTAAGETIYAVEGQRSTLGRWRIGEHGDFESQWGAEPWERYPIVTIDEELHWVAQSGARLPFKILPGEQLVWPQ